LANRATIKFKSGSLAGRSFSLGPGEYFFIGSGEACAVRILDDPSVEPTHAAIFYDPSGMVMFKDMGTKSGTLLNGKRIKKPVLLRAGDRVTIGQFSTFQSSWWNALQATKMTKFSNIKLSPTSSRARSPYVHALIAFAVCCVLLMSGWYLLWGSASNISVTFNDNGGRAETGRIDSFAFKDVGIKSGELSAKIFGQKVKRPGVKRIQMTPERRFIWDEIVAISKKFGDVPPSAMDPGFVKEVERHLAKFTARGGHQILLERKQKFNAMIEKTLMENGLPAELGYVVWVESNYVIDAKSPVGALGLWQFMPETGAEYGLRVGVGAKDQRLDPVLATRAAAGYFTSLLKMFGTERYLLAIASYNTGQNRVKRHQIATTVHKEHTSDFWQIRKALPEETAQYVPKVIAAMIIGRNPGRYSLSH